MKLESAFRVARQGRLYPSLILHGGGAASRRAASFELGRLLLCEAVAEDRPCGSCRHCRRIGPDGDRFHPDFRVLERDLLTVTSVQATREFLQMARLAPFEARGQVFVVAEAETLSPEAANSLLKVLEEPPEGSPRHFLLLAPSHQDLLPTVRSRSWGIYLGSPESLSSEEVQAVSENLARSLSLFRETSCLLHLQAAARVLAEAGDWKDPRASRPWATAAAAVLRVAEAEGQAARRRQLLELAHEMLEAREWRLRAVSAERILQGLVSRHLGGGE